MILPIPPKDMNDVPTSRDWVLQMYSALQQTGPDRVNPQVLKEHLEKHGFQEDLKVLNLPTRAKMQGVFKIYN